MYWTKVLWLQNKIACGPVGHTAATLETCQVAVRIKEEGTARAGIILITY